jgi:hypothetical protein
MRKRRYQIWIIVGACVLAVLITILVAIAGSRWQPYTLPTWLLAVAAFL